MQPLRCWPLNLLCQWPLIWAPGVVLPRLSPSAGLGQVLEFMYTAKLSLSPENVEDVLAVAGFLQMQEIVNACNALKSLTVPAESQEPPAVTGMKTPRTSPLLLGLS